MNLPLNQILLGDCLELLRKLPDDCIDSVVTDPPYGLGNKDPEPIDIFMYVLGATLDTGGDFMGRDWEIPSVQVWREVYRVLKPGGYVATFAGTRTFDLISVGLRMAGFECRDTIAREFPTVELPILQWIQSQGMPKSHAIGKAIDKKLGKTRTKVVGVKRGHEEFAGRGNNSSVVNLSESGPHAEGFSRPWMKDPEQVERYHQQLAPESEEAAQWEGWGSALKPSWEPILLFRKPFKGTLADNVLEHGTGGLNIDATRVKHASKEDFEAHKAGVDAIKQRGGSRDKSWKNSSDLSGANEVKEGGRWPSNLVIEHSARCQREGTKRVKAITGGTAPPVRQREVYDAAGGYNKQGAEQPAVKAYGDADGLEEVEAWSCAEGCPARELNEQSGERPSTLTGRADPATSHRHPGTEMNANSAFLGQRTHLSRVYADGGGAARFFTQFEGEDWECVEGCPVKALDDQGGERRSSYTGSGDPAEVHSVVSSPDAKGFMTGSVSEHSHTTYQDSGGASRFFSQFDGVPFKYVPKANRREAGCGEFEVQHITLKPVSLIRWLVKLVTRKGGVVLDMYAGSGTTPHAAVLEGMKFIGVERDPVSHAEAERRLKIVLEREEERQYDQDLFEFAHGGEQGLL